MKNVIKKIMCLLMLVVLVFSVAACGSTNDKQATQTEDTKDNTQANTEQQPEEKETKTKEPVELIMAVHASWVRAGLQGWVDYINANADKFGAKIELDKLPDGEEGENLLQARFATNEWPDILCFHGAKSAKAEFGDNAEFVDLSGDWTEMYEKDTLDSFFFTIDGKLVAAPLGGINIGAMLYNKKVFSELGIEIPTTWEEFLAVCEKIKSAGKIPVYVSGKDAWTVQLWPMLGFIREFKAVGSSSEVMEPLNTNKAKYADKELFIDSLGKLLEIKDKGYINKTFLSDTYDNAQKALAEGEAAMYCMATWVMGAMRESYPDYISDIGAFAIPFDGDDALPAWMPWVMMVPAGENADVAKAVVLELQKKENVDTFFKAEAGIPMAKGIDINSVDLTPAEKEAYAIYTTPGRGYIEFGNLAIYGQGDNFPKNVQDMLIGTLTPKQVAQGIDEDTLMKAKALKDPNFN